MSRSWEYLERLRQMVDAATDYVLFEYGKSMRTSHEEVTRGYGRQAAGFSSGGVADFDDLAYSVDRTVSKAAEAIVWGLPIEDRMAINAVYVGGKWAKEKPLDLALLEAVRLFELSARSRGLL